MTNEQKGLVHLYVGDGKGKTTAAAGLAARALGVGSRVLFCQFLKGRQTGEVTSLLHLGATVLRAKHGEKFTFQMTPEELCQAKTDHEECFREAAKQAATGECGVVVLDEVVDAVNAGLLDLAELTSLIGSRPENVELVLTGRNPPKALEDLADYYTDFVCKKHPFRRGVPARQGIEY